MKINPELLGIKTIKEEWVLTSSTTMSYIGKSFTIPAKSIFSVTFMGQYGNSRPLAVGISTENGNACDGVYAYTPSSPEDTYKLGVTYSGYNNSDSSRTFYLFAKYALARTNNFYLEGFYITLN